MHAIIAVIAIAITLDIVITQTVTNVTKTLKLVPEDGRLNFTEVANKYGHSCVEYDVTTEDGYVLKLFNIPGDKSIPVLLIHGVFGTGGDFIMRGNTSLAIVLASKGFDVWALNVRGSRYSRRHVKLNPDKDKAFWDFSVHELGCYDLPINIDFVLNATGQTKLSVIGYSEGTTMALVLASVKPEYNEKINVFIALAPICYLQNTVGSITSLIRNAPFLNQLSVALSIEEIAGYFSPFKAAMNVLCTQLPTSFELCYKELQLPLVGDHSEFIDKEFFKIILGHFPAGTSRKNLVHFSQIANRKTFAQYDYGGSKNYEMYKSFSPPQYPLEKVTMDTMLVIGKNDYISTIKDTDLLMKKLVNVKRYIVLEPDLFNHFDHMWGYNAYQVLYPLVIDMLAEYN